MPRPLRTAWLVVGMLLTVAATASAAELPTPTIAPPIKFPDAPSGTAFEGNGMWIWYASRTSGGGNVDAVAARAQRSAVTTVFLKSSDGTSYWSQFNAPYVAALKARGLKVCAWQYVYGNHPVLEAREARRAIRAGAD